MGAAWIALLERFDRSPVLWYLLGAAGLWLLVTGGAWLVDHVAGWWRVKRHRYDGLQDPRVLRPLVKRHLELIKR